MKSICSNNDVSKKLSYLSLSTYVRLESDYSFGKKKKKKILNIHDIL